MAEETKSVLEKSILKQKMLRFDTGIKTPSLQSMSVTQLGRKIRGGWTKDVKQTKGVAPMRGLETRNFG